MKPLGNILGPAVGREEVLRTARAQQVLRYWPEAVGEALAARSQPDRYEKGTVWVSVEGSAWAQELRLSKPTILAKLNEMASDRSLFMDLRFGVRPIAVLDPESAIPDPVERADYSGLSIREIAEARLEHWRED